MRPAKPVLPVIIGILLLSVFASVLLESCANIIPPLGGPKDTLAPRLVNISPKDSTLNFKEKRIVFTFDEYVELDQIQENLLVSPTPKTTPIVESRLKTVTVRIKDTLQPNTTYVLEFGKAIRDVNESNPLKDFRYIFSTGTYLDSLEYQGRVLIAQTGKADSTLIAMLYTDRRDSAVVKEKPRYYTRVDTTGRFRFRNIAAGTYALYAVKDEGGSKRYMSPQQLFAFNSDSVVIGKGESQPITLYAYAEPEPPKKPKTTKEPATSERKKKDDETEQDRRLRFGSNLENGLHDILVPLTLNFPSPLKTFDTSKLILTDEKFVRLKFQLERDTTDKVLTLRYNWPLDRQFNLISEKSMATDSAGKSTLRNDTLTFRTMRDVDYGSIRFRFNNIDTVSKRVLQLVQNDEVKFSFPITGRELNIRRFRPAEFDLRILYDNNGNGKWDYGKFFGEKRQPERVQALGKKINIKANWDNEIEISL